ATVLTLPNAMAALGDSITRGFNACGFYVDCEQRSWSTGTSTDTGSHYLGILSQNPAIAGKNFNDAKTGAVAADMVGQAQRAVTQKVEYVTLLIGANDACRPTEGKMTSVAEYRKRVAAALKIIKSGLPDAKVFIASIPNVKKVWETSSGNFLARSAWKLGNICQSLLANPTSHSAADNQRRDRVVQRVVGYNSQLSQLCSGYGVNCKFDGGAVFNFNFGSELLSNFDFFHPNGDGQRALAQITRRASFQWQSAGNPVLP
ncbi:MAG: SGNH/GDSL hydrolase family protein, partial [Mycobacteriales bacterium]